jgi:TetR/AcrR family transcriptional regulator
MVKSEILENTEERILEAAKKVFMRKGSAGARMQDIADEAGINKALLHYYFRSKEKLFEVIFREAAGKLMAGINRIFDESGMDFFEQVRTFCRMYIELGRDHPYLPIFVLHEMHTGDGKVFRNIMAAYRGKPFASVVKAIQKAMAAKKINPVDPMQLILNMLSLCMFPVIAKPMFLQVSGVSEDRYNDLLESRSEEVSAFIINAIRYKK